MWLSLAILFSTSLLCLSLSKGWRRTAFIVFFSCFLSFIDRPLTDLLIDHGVKWVGLVYASIDAMTLVALLTLGGRGKYRIASVVFAYIPVQLAMTWQVLEKDPGMMYNYYEWFIMTFNLTQALILGGPIYAHFRRSRMARNLGFRWRASLAHSHLFRG